MTFATATLSAAEFRGRPSAALARPPQIARGRPNVGTTRVARVSDKKG